MSYGTYDNQSPLNQPFNPTANTGQGVALGGLLKQNNLPGAQDPNSQQYFQQMHKSMDGMNEALQKIEQGPGGPGQFGGGKGMNFDGSDRGGSKYTTSLPPGVYATYGGAQTLPQKFGTMPLDLLQ